MSAEEVKLAGTTHRHVERQVSAKPRPGRVSSVTPVDQQELSAGRPVSGLSAGGPSSLVRRETGRA